MGKTVFSVEVDANIHQLFPYLAHPRNRPQWQSSILELRLVDEGPARVGMRWWERARGFGRFEMEITECEPERRWAEQGRSPGASIDLALDFEPGSQPDTTRLTVALELRLGSVLSLTGPMAPLVLRPVMSADLRRAAELSKRENTE